MILSSTAYTWAHTAQVHRCNVSTTYQRPIRLCGVILQILQVQAGQVLLSEAVNDT
jgi:hypothetical protein